MKKNILAAAVGTTTVWFAATTAHAAFFQLAENSPAELGHAFAGGATIAEDASTVWYNPAGLTRLGGGPQLVLGGQYIVPSIEANNVSPSTFSSVPISAGNGGDAGETALVPNFYLSYPLNDRLRFGLGVNAPFGLATDYEDGWAGRYHADRSEIKSVNVNPSVGYKINDMFAVGAGFSYQWIEATLTNAVDFGSICAAASIPCGGPANADGSAKVEGDDQSYGYNLGVLWVPGGETRVGVAYRSKIAQRIKGTVNYSYPNATAAAVASALKIVNGSASAEVDMPATLSVSAYHRLGAGWAIMGDITRTYWSDLPQLRIKFGSGQADSVVTLGLEDVDRYALGVSFAPSGRWVYRAGVALDKSPTPNDELRTPRLPDADRTWFSLGAGFERTAHLSFDFAYTYIRVDDAKVNKSAGTSPADEDFFRGNLAADYEASTHILSAQLNWQFK